jgi:hypothetical protein
MFEISPFSGPNRVNSKKGGGQPQLFLENVGQTQFVRKWKITSNFYEWKMTLIFWIMEEDPKS